MTGIKLLPGKKSLGVMTVQKSYYITWGLLSGIQRWCVSTSFATGDANLRAPGEVVHLAPADLLIFGRIALQAYWG